MFQVIERLRSPMDGPPRLRGGAAAFSRAIAGEKTEIALGRDGLRAVEIAHAAYRASRDGITVRLKD
jgi:predicted dehydrogenase